MPCSAHARAVTPRRLQIAETQRALLQARAEEAKSANSGPAGPEVTRWMALKSVAESRTMLQTLFRTAVEQKAQVTFCVNSRLGGPCCCFGI